MDEEKLKQQYLRESVPSDNYEQFAEYCLSQAKEINLEKWSWDYIKQLSANFNAKIALRQKLNQSFAQYQENRDPQIQENVEQPPSALSLLDQVSKMPKKKIAGNWSPEISHEWSQITYPASFSSVNLPNFAVQNYQSVSGTVDNKPVVSQFQFWQLPDSSLDGPTRKKDQNQVNKNQTTSDLFSDFLNFPNVPESRNRESLNRSVDVVRVTQKLANSQFQSVQNILPSTTHLETSKESQKNNSIRKIDIRPLQKNDILHADKAMLKKKSQFKDKLKCFQSTKRKFLNEKNFQVTIRNHRIIERNFLVSDYAMFDVELAPSDTVVKRNYEDFSRLKNILSKQFPGIQLPFLKKEGWFTDLSYESVQHQKLMLELFINDLIRNEQLRNSRILEDFLTLKQHKQIKRKFEEYDRLNMPKSIEQLCLLAGTVEVEISDRQRSHRQHFTPYYQRMRDLLGQHATLNANLRDGMKEIQAYLAELTRVAGCILSETKKFNLWSSGFEAENIDKVFQMIKNAYEEQSKFFGAEIKLIDKTLLPFLRYEHDNFAQVSSLVDLAESFSKAYNRRSTVEKETDQQYMEVGKQWKDGVLTQSRNLTVLKYQAGYLNLQLSKQIKRILDEMGQKLYEKWKFCAERRSESLSLSKLFWANMSRFN